MNCHQDAAKRGWEIYKSQDPVPSRDDLNRQLQDECLDSVSVRMYRHYHRLLSNRFDEYMPINELDVLLKLTRNRAAAA